VERLDGLGVDQINLRKLPACQECNSFLGPVKLDHIPDRRKWVLVRLTRKYGKFLRMPEWSNEELAELDTGFAEDIRRHSAFAIFVKKRTAWSRSGGRTKREHCS
jgi:hypothetical protein